MFETISVVHTLFNVFICTFVCYNSWLYIQILSKISVFIFPLYMKHTEPIYPRLLFSIRSPLENHWVRAWQDYYLWPDCFCILCFQISDNSFFIFHNCITSSQLFFPLNRVWSCLFRIYIFNVIHVCLSKFQI